MTAAPIDLATIHLDKGAHDNPADGHCILEVASMLAKEPFTDKPVCVSPVLRTFAISLNDQWDDVQRQKLTPFIPRLVGTAGDGQDEARSYLALDWLIRTYTPAWLDLAGLTSEAAELRSLRRIVDMTAAEAAGPVVRAAGTKADASWDAAGAASRDATRAATRDAAWAAAWAASWDAAWAAAWAASRAAAWAATGAAAWAASRAATGAATGAALRPTVETLQASALDLFDHMIDPSAVSA